MSRPLLLFLGPVLPAPPDRGAALQNYHGIRNLSDHYDLNMLLFNPRGDPSRMPLETRVAHLREFGSVEVFDVPGERSGIRRRLGQFGSLFLGKSEVSSRYDSRDFRRRILEQVFERDPRLVPVDGMALLGHLPLLAGRRVVVAHARVESEDLRQRAALSGGIEAGYLNRQALWMRQAERKWLPRVTANLVTTPFDRTLMAERAPGARIEVMPAAVDTSYFAPAPSTGHGLAFVGGATAPANRDALTYFAQEILPRLRRQSGVQALEPISWVGSARDGDRERFREIGIDITGYVKDVRPIVRPAACYVVPRRMAGGGTGVLQAWAMGKAVVSTTVGCEGVEAVDGVNILIRDDPDSFARAVLDVLGDRELRQELGRSARATVEERYSWESTGPRLTALYEALEVGTPMRGGASGLSAPHVPPPRAGSVS
ncbi:MAG: glycosyltransferase family 4 protein [Gemmatimonadota bacterium]